jgi:hypothetical protein
VKATSSPELMQRVTYTAGMPMAQTGPSSLVVAHTLALPGVTCGSSTARTKSIKPPSNFESRGRGRNMPRHGIEGGGLWEALTNFFWVSFLCMVLCHFVVWGEGINPKCLSKDRLGDPHSKWKYGMSFRFGAPVLTCSC